MNTTIQQPPPPVKPLTIRVRIASERILATELGLSLARRILVFLDDKILGDFETMITGVSAVTGQVRMTIIPLDPITQSMICQHLADLPQLSIGNGYLTIGNPTEPHVRIVFR